MLDNLVVRARTALSPEWDRGFDEAFTELVSNDPDLVQAEFDELIAASWPDPPGPGGPPASPRPAARPAPASGDDPAAAPPDGETTGHVVDPPRPPP